MFERILINNILILYILLLIIIQWSY